MVERHNQTAIDDHLIYDQPVAETQIPHVIILGWIALIVGPAFQLRKVLKRRWMTNGWCLGIIIIANNAIDTRDCRFSFMNGLLVLLLLLSSPGIKCDVSSLLYLRSFLSGHRYSSAVEDAMGFFL